MSISVMYLMLLDSPLMLVRFRFTKKCD